MFSILRRKKEADKWPLPWTHGHISIAPKLFMSKKKFVNEVYKYFSKGFDDYLFIRTHLRIPFGGLRDNYRSKKELVRLVDSAFERNPYEFSLRFIVRKSDIEKVLKTPPKYFAVFSCDVGDVAISCLDSFLVHKSKELGVPIPKISYQADEVSCEDCGHLLVVGESYPNSDGDLICPDCGNYVCNLAEAMTPLSKKDRGKVIEGILNAEDSTGVLVTNRGRWLSGG